MDSAARLQLGGSRVSSLFDRYVSLRQGFSFSFNGQRVARYPKKSIKGFWGSSRRVLRGAVGSDGCWLKMRHSLPRCQGR